MAKDFNAIEIDEILNYEHAETGVIARYERIMRHHTVEAMNELSGRLDSLTRELGNAMTTLLRIAQLAQDEVEHAISSAGKARQIQRRQQAATKWLAGVLVVWTFFYTVINVVVAYEMHHGNEIQRAAAIAAREQAAAARASTAAQGHAPVSSLSEPQTGTNAVVDRVKGVPVKVQ